MRRRSFPGRRVDPASARGNVRIRLLDGRRLVANLSGPPPRVLKIDVPQKVTVPGSKSPPERTALCRRVDLEEYVEMSANELRKEGLTKRPHEKDAELDKKASPLI